MESSGSQSGTPWNPPISEIEATAADLGSQGTEPPALGRLRQQLQRCDCFCLAAPEAEGEQPEAWGASGSGCPGGG